jgi:phosphatidylserine/phosphatidylglycerophosphate/cardiolipin synthase-like enzyme
VIRLSSHSAFLGAIAHASRVRVTAYILGGGSLVPALEAASERGASVEVEVERAPFADSKGHLARLNHRTVRELRRHGVSAHLTRRGEPPLHLKAAVVDGQAFLDDRNWPSKGDDTIVTTSAPRDLKRIGDALAGEPDSADAALALHKGYALQLEADTIDAAPAGSTVDCESETFGASTVARALARRALRGERVHLLVTRKKLAGNPAERRTLAELRAAGVEIRLTDADEKVALTASGGWVGSANATSASPEMLDWGARTCDPNVLATLRGRFEVRWDPATPLVA